MGALDSLFSILPIVFVVIWVLRSVGKVRKKSQSAGGNARRPAPDGAPRGKVSIASLKTVKAPASESLSKWIADKAREAGMIADGSVREAAIPRGEEELYERMDSRRIEPAEHHPVSSSSAVNTEEETKRMVADVDPSGDRSPSGSEPAVLKRIASMPPLAQGVLWSVILDKPLALKDSF